MREDLTPSPFPNGKGILYKSKIDKDNLKLGFRGGKIERTVVDPKNWILPLGVEFGTRKEVCYAEETTEF